MIASQSKRPDLAAESDNQHEDHAAREKQLSGWQAEIAREAEEGHGLDALQTALSELKVNYGADELFTFRAVDELRRCADRHLSELHYPETIHALFAAGTSRPGRRPRQLIGPVRTSRPRSRASLPSTRARSKFAVGGVPHKLRSKRSCTQFKQGAWQHHRSPPTLTGYHAATARPKIRSISV